jgi:hypothetical protein
MSTNNYGDSISEPSRPWLFPGWIKALTAPYSAPLERDKSTQTVYTPPPETYFVPRGSPISDRPKLPVEPKEKDTTMEYRQDYASRAKQYYQLQGILRETRPMSERTNDDTVPLPPS